jgi:hypothetical protein
MPDRYARERVALGRQRLVSADDSRREPEKSYRVVSVSLYVDQADLVDRATETLLRAGFAKANRSLVVQTAIQRLRQDLEGKSPEEMVAYFLDSQVRRPLAAAAGRTRYTPDVRLRKGRAG